MKSAVKIRLLAITVFICALLLAVMSFYTWTVSERLDSQRSLAEIEQMPDFNSLPVPWHDQWPASIVEMQKRMEEMARRMPPGGCRRADLFLTIRVFLTLHHQLRSR